MSFGIGAFPFGLFASVFNVSDGRPAARMCFHLLAAFAFSHPLFTSCIYIVYSYLSVIFLVEVCKSFVCFIYVFSCKPVKHRWWTVWPIRNGNRSSVHTICSHISLEYWMHLWATMPFVFLPLSVTQALNQCGICWSPFLGLSNEQALKIVTWWLEEIGLLQELCHYIKYILFILHCTCVTSVYVFVCVCYSSSWQRATSRWSVLKSYFYFCRICVYFLVDDRLMHTFSCWLRCSSALHFSLCCLTCLHQTYYLKL